MYKEHWNMLTACAFPTMYPFSARHETQKMEFWIRMWSQWIIRSEGLCCRKAEWGTEVCSLSRVVLGEATIWSTYKFPFLQLKSTSQLLILLVSEHLGELVWKSCYTYIKDREHKAEKEKKKKKINHTKKI